MSDIAERVKKIVVEHLGVEPDKVTENASFIDDLGADSLDTVELVMAFEEEFGVEIPDDAAETILTVGDAVKFIEKNAKAERRSPDADAGRARRICAASASEGTRAMRRVVVTGLGMVTPLGCGVEATWKRLLAGESGARRIDSLRRRRSACKIACQIPRGDGADGTFNPDQWMEPKEQRKVDDFIVYAMAAADAGARRCRLEARDATRSRSRTGVLIGSGIGGIDGIAETAITLHEQGPRRVSPFFIPGRLINLASGQVSIEHGLKGPNHAVVTACSTGAHAIGDAARLIALGDADVMVAGGAEVAGQPAVASPASPPAARCRPASTTTPEQASRPYDRTATASSWARAPASSCSRSTSTPRRAARRSTPR